MQLLQAVEPHELDSLHEQWGQAPHQKYKLFVDHPFLTGEHEQLTSGTRRAEICYIMHRGNPAQGVLLHTKTIYPDGGDRLPTGGIHEGESVMDTLVREIYEETGLTVGPDKHEAEIQKYLGVLSYEMFHASSQETHTYATYCFLVQVPPDAEPEVQDPEELISGWFWYPLESLTAVNETLHGIGQTAPDWADWGRYRAIVHKFVAEVL